LFSVDRGTVSRWENATLRVDRSAFVVLGGLVMERLSGRSDTLSRLKAVQKPCPVSNQVVRIKCTSEARATAATSALTDSACGGA
jgi:hypothetical protein